jgi:hypothetical protein
LNEWHGRNFVSNILSKDEALREELHKTKGTAAAKAFFLAIFDGNVTQLAALNDLLVRASCEQCTAAIDECRAFAERLGVGLAVSVSGYSSSFPAGPAVWSLKFEFMVDVSRYSYWLNILDRDRVNVRPEAQKEWMEEGFRQLVPVDAGEVLPLLQSIVKAAANKKLIERYS